jgi:hypothetical protein
MAPHKDNIYSVNAKITDLQARVLALETANEALRIWVLAELATKIKDSENVIHDAIAADFRDLQEAFGVKFSDLQASIRIPRDGVDGAPGPRGEAGSVTVIPESEMAQAVLDLRRELKEKHAAFIAVIVNRLEYEKAAGIEGNGAWVHRHFAKLLESIKADIERLR